MTRSAFSISVIVLAVLSNALFINIVGYVSYEAALFTYLTLSIIAAGLIIYGVKTSKVDPLIKLSLLLSTIYSVGLLSLNFFTNVHGVPLSDTGKWQYFLIISSLGAIVFGVFGYLRGP